MTSTRSDVLVIDTVVSLTLRKGETLSGQFGGNLIRPIAVGRRNWTFAGSDAGGRRAAAMYTLLETAKLNGIDPRAWLADVIARLPEHPAQRISELLPWNWTPLQPQRIAA